ncbi:MAG: hypothetical protein M5U14_11005 [Acidimicrobiia bacterium]|nr:hypothetical protein [Acidimicrobiia bacterium]
MSSRVPTTTAMTIQGIQRGQLGDVGAGDEPPGPPGRGPDPGCGGRAGVIGVLLLIVVTTPMAPFVLHAMAGSTTACFGSPGGVLSAGSVRP